MIERQLAYQERNKIRATYHRAGVVVSTKISFNEQKQSPWSADVCIRSTKSLAERASDLKRVTTNTSSGCKTRAAPLPTQLYRS
jgi:hypothetical protein